MMFARCLPDVCHWQTSLFVLGKGSDKNVCQMFAKPPMYCRNVCQIYPLGYLANMANIWFLAVIISKKCLPTYLKFEQLGKHLF